MPVQPVPEGYASLTPYLIIQGAEKAIDWYKQVLGASERMRMAHEGKIMHAELQLGDSVLMLADEFPEMGHVSPATVGRTTVSLMYYVPDVDAVFDRAIQGGAKSLRPVQNQFYGDRTGTFSDPFGHIWSVGTHVEDVSPEEMERRMSQQGK